MRFRALVAAVFVGGCASLANIMPPQPVLMEGDAAALRSAVLYNDDPLNTSIGANSGKISSSWYIFGVGSQDVILSAARDRADSDWIFMLTWRSESRDWLFPSAVNFGAPVKSYELHRADSDVACSGSGCSHSEVSTAILDDAAIAAILRSSPTMPMRFVTRRGYVDTILHVDELRALLGRIGQLERFEPSN